MAARPAALFSGNWRGTVSPAIPHCALNNDEIASSLCIVAALVQISHSWAHEARPAFRKSRKPRRAVTGVLCARRARRDAIAVVLKFRMECATAREPVTQWLTTQCRTPGDRSRSGGLAGKSIEFAGLQATITDVLAHVQTRDGLDTTTLVRPSQARLVMATPRSWLEIASNYILHGIQHISFGVDHLLFVLGFGFDREAIAGCCLKTVTAFNRRTTALRSPSRRSVTPRRPWCRSMLLSP